MDATAKENDNTNSQQGDAASIAGSSMPGFWRALVSAISVNGEDDEDIWEAAEASDACAHQGGEEKGNIDISERNAGCVEAISNSGNETKKEEEKEHA